MSALQYVAKVVLPAAYSMLPEKMTKPESRQIVLAIGLQESKFEHRRQLGGGPAISFWQGEFTGGFPRLVNHPATRDVARDLLRRMGYGDPDKTDFQALEHNDIAGCCAARLLLWTHHKQIPGPLDYEGSWQYYIDLWRPGKPHRKTWNEYYKQALEALQTL